MRVAASNIAITPPGACIATPPNSTACWSSDAACRASDAASPRTCASRDCRARRCWQRWYGCSKRTLVRVGNEEYARSNGSFGLTTLRDRHVNVRGEQLTLEFRGKSGIAHSVSVNDPALARIVRRCTDIPGQELFQWIDAEGQGHKIGSADVNEYLREASGGDFTAKDFRTWFATVEALQALRKRPVGGPAEVKKELLTTIAAVARRLGNTPTICRKCYIHPEVLTAFADGRLAKLNGAQPAAALRGLLRHRSARGRRTPTLR